MTPGDSYDDDPACDDVPYLDDEACDDAVGSCEECGTNLYEEDDEEYCEQCLWRMRFWR